MKIFFTIFHSVFDHQLAGATFNNVIKATVYLADINDFSAVNEIYKTYFTEDFPARAAMQVKGESHCWIVNIEDIEEYRASISDRSTSQGSQSRD